MAAFDLSAIQIAQIATHFVGNKNNEQDLILGKNQTFFDGHTEKFLMKYFIQSFKTEEFFNFTHPISTDRNDLYSICEALFLSQSGFQDKSIEIAKLLYNKSVHPNIKSGDLNVVYFTNAQLGEENVDVIGIFKSENDIPFLKITDKDNEFTINHIYGYGLKNLDKGCLIFNSMKEQGYKILMLDQTNKSGEAHYWKDEFLMVKEHYDQFLQTNQFLNITKEYLTDQLVEDFELNRCDQIDLLNKSVDYFKRNETFERAQFEYEVLEDKEMIESFRKFDVDYRRDHSIEMNDNFDISKSAVRKQARIFKSVLKLDKNFHIYIHGDKDQIEQGVESDGRKFYKIYYDEEF